jgi:hypothetical protein
VLRFGFLGIESRGPGGNGPIRRRLAPLSRHLAAAGSQDVVTLTLQTTPMDYQVGMVVVVMVMMLRSNLRSRTRRRAGVDDGGRLRDDEVLWVTVYGHSGVTF